MKVKEAILTLNANVVIDCERAGFSSATVKMIEDALNTIEDALKEQEPIKPNHVNTNYEQHFKCGACNAVINDWDKFCHEGGRPVKWEGVEPLYIPSMTAVGLSQ